MTDAEEFAASAAAFESEHVAPHQSALWPCSFTLSTDPADPKKTIAAYGRPATRGRVPDEMRGGYIVRTVRAFALLRSQIPTGASVGLGTEFTVTADTHTPANIGTVWRCFEISDPSAGSQLRAGCFRLD